MSKWRIQHTADLIKVRGLGRGEGVVQVMKLLKVSGVQLKQIITTQSDVCLAGRLCRVL